MSEIDWRHVAVSVARADGRFYLLTTPERDALEAAMSEAPPPDPMMPIRDAAQLVRDFERPAFSDDDSIGVSATLHE